MQSLRLASLLLLLTALPAVHCFAPCCSPSHTQATKLHLASAANAKHHQPHVASWVSQKEPHIPPLFLRGSKDKADSGIALRSGDGFDYEDTVRMPISQLEHEDEQLIVIDPEEQKIIRCLIDQQVVIDGIEYVLGYPCDHAVVLAYPDPNSDALNAVPPADVPALFPAASAAAREEGLSLINSAVVLTLQGELTLGEDSNLNQEDLVPDEDLVRIIASFEVKGAQCVMTEPLDPVLVVSRVCPQPFPLADQLLPPPQIGERRLVCELLAQPELEAVLPKIEAVLSKRFNSQLDEAGIMM